MQTWHNETAIQHSQKEDHNVHMQTVLVVDDDRTTRFVLGELLRAHGYRVLEATDGVEALRLVEQQVIDLVVSDIRMPHMRGDELAEQLGRSYPQIKVLLTSSAPENVLSYQQMANLPQIMSKTTLIETLLSSVQNMLSA